MIAQVAAAVAPLVQNFSESATGRHVEAGGMIDWGLVAFSIGVVIVVTVMAVWYFVRPGEDDPDHIKRTVLRDSTTPPSTR